MASAPPVPRAGGPAAPQRSVAPCRGAWPNLPLVSCLLELRRILADCDSVLDMGCGPSSPLRYLPFRRAVGMEAYRPAFEAAARAGTHHELHLGDVRAAAGRFAAGSFCCCVAVDLIEHLTQPDGYRLIEDMARLASRRVVLLTPNGFLPQQGQDGDLQAHHSGWTAADLRRLGFRVTGLYGLRSLRGERHALRFRPRLLWGVVSELTHYLHTHSHPERAAALLAVKDLPPAGGRPGRR